MNRWQTFVVGVICGIAAALASLFGAYLAWWDRHGL